MFDQLKKKQDLESQKKIQHEDDQYYYIIHPDHIENYLGKLKEKEFIPEEEKQQEQEQNQDNSNQEEQSDEQDRASKTVIYHDINTNDKFKHEVLVKHQYNNIEEKNNKMEIIKRDNNGQWQQNLMKLKQMEQLRFKDLPEKEDQDSELKKINERLDEQIMNEQVKFNDSFNNLTNNYGTDLDKEFKKYYPKEYKKDQEDIEKQKQQEIDEQQKHKIEEQKQEQKNSLEVGDKLIQALIKNNKRFQSKDLKKNKTMIGAISLEEKQKIEQQKQIELNKINEKKDQERLKKEEFEKLEQQIQQKKQQIEKRNRIREQKQSQSIDFNDYLLLKPAQYNYIPFYNKADRKSNLTEWIKQNLNIKEQPQKKIEDKSSLEKFQNLLFSPPQLEPQSFLQSKQVQIFSNQNFLFNYTNIRRQRRGNIFPDPLWDCMKKTILQQLQFTCEQQVSMSYTKYCQNIINQIDKIVEGYLYKDTEFEICRAIGQCMVDVDQ